MSTFDSLVEVKKITELPDKPVALDSYFPHGGADGKLGKAKIGELSLILGGGGGGGGVSVNLTDPQFGGVGDFNFTTGIGTDNTAALRAAIAYCTRPEIINPLSGINADGRPNYWKYIQPTVVNYIYVPFGAYKITETILLPPYIRIVGCSTANYITGGMQGSTFVASGITGHVFASATVRFSDGVIDPNAFVTAVDIDAGNYTYVPSPEFERLCIMKDPTKPQVPLSMIKLSGATHAQIHHCTLIGSKFGIILNTSWNWDVGNNMIIPTICGVVLTESITTGSLYRTEVNGALMPTSGLHTDNTLPYGFAALAGDFHSGKCVGFYMAHANVEFKNNVAEFNMYYGVAVYSSGGVIDNTYVEGIAAAGAAYAQKLSAYMVYIVGEVAISSGTRLFHFTDFARGEVHFRDNYSGFDNLGTVHPSCDIKLFQFKNLGVSIPKGMRMADRYGADIQVPLQFVLGYNNAKVFNLTGDSPISADVNLPGDTFELGNGKATPTLVDATARVYCFTRDVTFRDLTINVNIAGMLTPVTGKYVFRFINCIITQQAGMSLFTNNQAFVGQECHVEIIFENCTVSSAVATYLFGGMSTTWARLNVAIKQYSSTFTNVYIPTDSLSLKVIDAPGYPSHPTRADGNSYAGGRMLNTDPLFRTGLNGITAYNTLANTNVVVSRVASSNAPIPPPTDSGFVLKIVNSGAAAPDNGGFKFSTPTRDSAVFRVRFIALVPLGMTISLTTGAYGTGGYTTENKPNFGTGKWTEYIFSVHCGSGGTFDVTNLFSFIGLANQTIWICYATVFDMRLEPLSAALTQAQTDKIAASLAPVTGSPITSTGVWVGTQAQYDALTTKVATVIYLIQA